MDNYTIMRSKLHWLDLAICGAWIVSIVCDGYGLTPFTLLAMLMRLVVSFSLFYKEKRSWMPLLALAVSLGLAAYMRLPGGIGGIVQDFFVLFGLEPNKPAEMAMTGVLLGWILFAPYVYYVVMLLSHRLVNTEWTKTDLLGGILWNDRRARYYAALLMITVVSLAVGLSMYTPSCKLLCWIVAPLCYWIVCRYCKVKAQWAWLLVAAMVVFWYAQKFGGIYRVGMLAASFMLVAYVCTSLYKSTRQILMTGICALYFAVVLPSFTIGYNQYACINYGRRYFSTLVPYCGIMQIFDAEGNVGLRDRYGLLLSPEYEHLSFDFTKGKSLFRYCRLAKDGYTQIYDLYDNKILPSERDAKLQHDLCEIIEEYYAGVDNDGADYGEVKVTDLSTNTVVGHTRIKMYYNPVRYYEDENCIPDDTANVEAGNHIRTDSVLVMQSAEYGSFKNVLSYCENIPNDSCPRYQVYVRLAQDKEPEEKDIEAIMAKVRHLDRFRKGNK